MKKYLLLFHFAAIISLAVSAQGKFLRQNINAFVYSQIDSVFLTAQNGDTIYLPGGSYNIGTLIIDKNVKVFGAGHFPDSTTATNPTILNGSIRLYSGASNSMLTGFYLTGDIYFGNSTANNNATQIEILRCNVQNITLNYDYYSQNSNVSFINIKENIIRGSVLGMKAQNILVEKNLINGAIEHFGNGNLLVKNNTFLGGAGCPAFQFNNIYNSLIQNNIIMNSGACSNQSIQTNVNSCTFQNNVFNGNFNFPYGTNIGTGNWANVSFTNFFVNETNFTIDYQSDYHIQNPTTYLGTDGTQVGIYGTTAPFKVGSLPTNPHISSKNIAPQTNSNGDLNIQIQVNAQNN
ncbi:MAG: hypothetical protein ACK4IK_09225 [Bacteroidia bacterium]